jgi:hypothetical protein
MRAHMIYNNYSYVNLRRKLKRFSPFFPVDNHTSATAKIRLKALSRHLLILVGHRKKGDLRGILCLVAFSNVNVYSTLQTSTFACGGFWLRPHPLRTRIRLLIVLWLLLRFWRPLWGKRKLRDGLAPLDVFVTGGICYSIDSG